MKQDKTRAGDSKRLLISGNKLRAAGGEGGGKNGVTR